MDSTFFRLTCTHLANFYFYLAPEQPVQNISTESLSSITIQICFYPPFPVNQNGPLTSFNILYTGNPFDAQTKNLTIPISPAVYPLSTMFCANLTNLQEYNNYTVSIEAVNANGDGPASVGTVEQTDSSGECII